MALYGIRLVINIFDLCIFWRFLEVFIGKRKTSVEISIVVLMVCEAAGSIINLKGINWLNLITLAAILGILICQYTAKISTKVVAVMMYMGLVGCFLLIEVVREQLSVRTGILCMCIIFTIILTDYMVFLMMESYTDMAEKQHEEELVLSEITYQNEYYRDMEQYQEQIQDIKHDMKNRLGTLYDAAGEGDSSMVMAALKEILEDISLAEDIIYSANPVLNSILKIKAAKAKENGIEVRIHAFIPKKVSIETGDMGVLYGNLLDNAIEACCRVGQEKRFLVFETKYQDGNLLILIKNSKTGEENKKLVTTKKDNRMKYQKMQRN